MSDPILPVLPVSLPTSSPPPRYAAVGSSVDDTPSSVWAMCWSMWWSPRRAFRARLERSVAPWSLLLVTMSSYVLVSTGDVEVAGAARDGLIGAWSALTLAPLAVLLVFALRRFVMAQVGRWLGGTAATSAVGAALAWAWLPLSIVGAVQWLGLIAALLASVGPPEPLFAASTAIAAIADRGTDHFGLVVFIAVVWSMLREVWLVAVAHEFSRWRALLVCCASVAALVFAFAVAGKVAALLR